MDGATVAETSAHGGDALASASDSGMVGRMAGGVPQQAATAKLGSFSLDQIGAGRLDGIYEKLQDEIDALDLDDAAG